MRAYGIFLLAGIVSLFFFLLLGYNTLSSIAIGIFFYWIFKLLLNSNYYLPLMELFLSLYALQFLFSPALTYNGFEEFTRYKMRISGDEYFSYVIPVFLSFALGFKVFFKEQNFRPDIEIINNWLLVNPRIPYVFIFIGYASPFLYPFVSANFHFIIYLLESFKFIGLFILISSFQKLKPVLLGAIYLSILISSFMGGMFHDLLTWLIMLGLVLSYRYQPSLLLKFVGVFCFVVLALFIQSSKEILRIKIWEEGKSTSFDLVSNIGKENAESSGGFFSKENIGPHINRINQGWVTASAINHVPLNIEHSEGTITYEYLRAALLPRFMAPDKLKGGDTRFFNEYSGHFVDENTVMVLGLFTEGYVEFGKQGAILYVFVFGIIYGLFLKKLKEYSSTIPILMLFSILIFIYPMRPDCDTQTAIGHLIKTSLFLFLALKLFSKQFVVK